MAPTDVLRANLEAIRANAEAALALLGDPAPATETGPTPEPCLHPPHLRRPAAVGGDPGQFVCGACHTLVPGVGA